MRSRHRVPAALMAVCLLLLGGCGSDGADSGSGATTPDVTGTTAEATGKGPQLGPALDSIASLPGALKTAPPWPANNGTSLQLRLRAIGLDPLTEEGQVVHIHQHLDLFVDGRQVTIPANVGIDAKGGYISDLHTHDTSGILHVESPTQQSFGLGQLFAVWGLPLSASCVGSLCEQGAKRLKVWVNGEPVSADPTRIVLAEHQEIVIAYGTAAQDPDPVPATYDFAAVGL